MSLSNGKFSPKAYLFPVLKSRLAKMLFNSRFGKIDRVTEGTICIVLSESNRLGDLIIHNFLIQQLELWGYKLVFGVSSPFYKRHREFFQQHCLTKRILVLPTGGWQRLLFIFRIKKEKIRAVVLDTHPVISDVFFYLAGIPVIFGPRDSGLSFSSKPYHFDKANLHYTELVNSLLQLLDDSIVRKNVHDIRPFFPYIKTEIADLDQVMTPCLAVHMGGSNHWNRKWPVEKYLLLCQLFLDNYEGRIILVGGKEEQEGAAAVKSILEENCNAPGRIINACGTDLNTTANTISRCHAFVGNDSGPMHIANSLNKRVVVICGPSAIAAVNPTGYDKRNFTVRLDLECVPCIDRVCRLPEGKKFSCLNDLHVEMVWQRLQLVIHQPNKPARLTPSL